MTKEETIPYTKCSEDDTKTLDVTMGVPCGPLCLGKDSSGNYMLDCEGVLIEKCSGGWRFRYESVDNGKFVVLSTCRLSARVIARHCPSLWGKEPTRNYKSLVPDKPHLNKYCFMRAVCDSENLYNWNNPETGLAVDQRKFDDLERRYKVCCNVECGRRLTSNKATEICFFFGASQGRISFYVCAVCRTTRCINSIKVLISRLFPVDPFKARDECHHI